MDAVSQSEVRILLHIVFVQLKIGDLQQSAKRVAQVARSQVPKALAPALLSSADLMRACAVGALHYFIDLNVKTVPSILQERCSIVYHTLQLASLAMFTAKI